MPETRQGQQITFAVEVDEDVRFRDWRWVDLKFGDTVRKVAGRYGHPEDARRIADKNKIRDVTKTLRRRHPRRKGKHKQKNLRRLRVPGELRGRSKVSALAGDTPPVIVQGYAKLGAVDRPERVGLTSFDGYDPLVMEVPVRFDSVATSQTGAELEQEIVKLELMTGRGLHKGAGVGPPPIIRVSTTSDNGRVIPLIPSSYQWAHDAKDAPVWRVAGIDWSTDVPAGVLRNASGNRVRQLCVVRLQEHTPIHLLQRSVSDRAKEKRKHKERDKKRDKKRGSASGSSG